MHTHAHTRTLKDVWFYIDVYYICIIECLYMYDEVITPVILFTKYKSLSFFLKSPWSIPKIQLYRSAGENRKIITIRVVPVTLRRL